MARRWSVRPRLTPDVARAALRDPDLRNVQLSWLLGNAGKWGYLVLNLVFAYEAGGPAGAGLVGLAAFVPSTVAAPLAGLASNGRPERVLAIVAATRTLFVALTVGLVAFDGPLLVLLVLVGLESAARSMGRPMHMALLPLLARTPAELVAANAASSAAEGLGVFAGPAIAGLLLGATGLIGGHLSVLVVYALAVVTIARLRVPATRLAGRPRDLRSQLALGGRAVITLPAVRWLVVVIAAQTLVRGVLVVMTVVAAIELFGMGEAGTGILNAAFGAGGLVGAIAAMALAGRTRLAPWVNLSLAGWGAPIAIMGWLGDPVVAIAMMALIGASNATLDVSTFTLLQRTSPNAARVGVLGIVDSVANGGQAIGGALAPLLLGAVGPAGTLVVAGLSLPAMAVLTWFGVRSADDAATVDPERLALIRADPLFAPLSMAIVEQLAGELESTAFEDGAWLMREGESGDRYYLIASGRVRVTREGNPMRELGRGEGVGEIALLRDVPRTASVRAVGPVETLALERGAFLAAVTGTPASRVAADAVIDERLAPPVLH
ncbi:MAG TPA: MFS transporter [Clostridia bacterium]|nr:MFS transporter [Clostridia bacterium]